MCGPRLEAALAAARLCAVLSALVCLLALVPDDGRAQSKPRIVPGRDPGGTAVAVVDSGVNYTLAELAARLARDGEGDIIGMDLSERDNRPFDRAPTGAPPADAVSGTTLAGIIAHEARNARIVPVRVAAADARTLAGALTFVQASPARIVLVSVPIARPELWADLRAAAAARPAMLIILAAGDDGADLDQRPGWSAEHGIANLLVVSASDGAGALLARANAGARAVDLIVPADRLAAPDRDGRTIEASGTRVAAARVAALAARLAARNPRLDGAALKLRIVALARATAHAAPPRVRHGFIADPAAIERDP